MNKLKIYQATLVARESGDKTIVTKTVIADDFDDAILKVKNSGYEVIRSIVQSGNVDIM